MTVFKGWEAEQREKTLMGIVFGNGQWIEIILFLLLGFFFIYAHKKDWVSGKVYGKKIPIILIGTAVSFLIPGVWIFAGTALYVCFLIAYDGLFSNRI